MSRHNSRDRTATAKGRSSLLPCCCPMADHPHLRQRGLARLPVRDQARAQGSAWPVVLPAPNEAATVRHHRHVDHRQPFRFRRPRQRGRRDRLGSTDETAEVAIRRGPSRPREGVLGHLPAVAGKGEAMWRGSQQQARTSSSSSMPTAVVHARLHQRLVGPLPADPEIQP